MIKTFRHKGLKAFFEHGDVSKIRPEHADRISLILGLLNRARTIEEMGFPGSGLHGLRGDKSGYWAVKVNANWRIVFRFEGGHAFDVDYQDYH